MGGVIRIFSVGRERGVGCVENAIARMAKNMIVEGADSLPLVFHSVPGGISACSTLCGSVRFKLSIGDDFPLTV